jgi:hypothetical protein
MMESREWGWMMGFKFFSLFWVKFIHVKKGEMTSLQYHNWRKELHISLKGIQYAPNHTTHRLIEGSYIEIAWGDLLEEDDIIRIKDKYGRK